MEKVPRDGGDQVASCFFLTDDNKLMSVTIDPGAVIGRTTEVLDNRPYVPFLNNGVDLDVAPDGRFLTIKLGDKSGTPASPSALMIVTHWVDELKSQSEVTAAFFGSRR